MYLGCILVLHSTGFIFSSLIGNRDIRGCLQSVKKTVLNWQKYSNQKGLMSRFIMNGFLRRRDRVIFYKSNNCVTDRLQIDNYFITFGIWVSAEYSNNHLKKLLPSGQYSILLYSYLWLFG